MCVRAGGGLPGIEGRWGTARDREGRPGTAPMTPNDAIMTGSEVYVFNLS